jgi:ketosteroid isomerase-like protein
MICALALSGIVLRPDAKVPTRDGNEIGMQRQARFLSPPVNWRRITPGGEDMRAVQVMVFASMIGFWSLTFFRATEAGGEERQSNAASEVKELIKLDQEWVEAGRQRDVAYLNHLFTDDFVESSAGSGGEISNKAQLFKKITSPERKFSGGTLDDIHVHLHGDTAVVTDHTSAKGTIGGQDISGDYRAMRFFVKQQGRWRAAGAAICPMGLSAYTSAASKSH